MALIAAKIEDSESDDGLALGKLVSYVCERVKQLNLEMPTYLLEMALTSLVQDINERDIRPSDFRAIRLVVGVE